VGDGNSFPFADPLHERQEPDILNPNPAEVDRTGAFPQNNLHAR
jgi:hypothetical protein